MTGQLGGVAVGRERAGARSCQPAGVAGRQREPGCEMLAPLSVLALQLVWPASGSTWAALEVYLPEFYSPSSSHVPGAAGKVPVRPIAVDNSKHFPHDHGN